MSFNPYHYVDYSNPTTPRVYSWEIPAEQPPIQMNPQEQPQEQPQQQQQQEQLQEQAQHHQQQQQQQQPQQGQQQPQQQRRHELYPVTPSTIHLQEQMPRQQRYRFDITTEEHFIQASARASASASASEGRPGSSQLRGASRPPLHVDTRSRASTSPGESSAGVGIGPLRIQHARMQPVHPYQRHPSSGGALGLGVGAGSAAPAVRARRVSELQQTQMGMGRASVLPTVGSSMAVSCPAATSWRDNLLRRPIDNINPATISPGSGATPAPIGASHTPPRPQAQAQGTVAAPRRYNICTDVHYNAEENMMTAMLELPGVKKADLQLTMSVCPYSRVRQLTVSGTSRPALPRDGHAVLERKFGEFARTLVVPPGTRAEDVVAILEDGILTLRIPGGQRSEIEQRQDIPIR